MITCLLFGLAISAIRTYIGVFYVGQQVDSMLIWSGSDAPNIQTPNPSVTPIWGVHYFGDLQEAMNWSKALLNGLNPYDYLANYPPFSFLVTLPLSQVEAKLAVPLVIASCAFALGLVGWLMTRGLRKTQRAALVIVCIVITTPFLGLLDRGNLTLLVAVLIGFYLLVWSRSRAAGIALGTAIAIKIFPITLLVLATVRQRRGEAAIALAIAIGLTTIAFILLPGEFSDSLSGLILAADKSSGLSNSESNYSTFGLLQQTGMLFFPARSLDSSPLVRALLVALPAVLWLSTLVWLLRCKLLPSWALGLLALAGLQLLPPTSNVYSCFGAMFAALWFAAPANFPSIGSDSREREFVMLRLAAILYCVVTLTPIGLHLSFRDNQFGLAAFLSPLAAWIVMLIAIVENRKALITRRVENTNCS